MDEDVTPERWLPVVGFEGWYEISDLGRVRSVDRIVPCSNGQRQLHRGRMRAVKVIQGKRGAPYHYVLLRTGMGRQVSRKIHQLVAEAFIGPRPEGMEVRHGEGGSLDNRPCNLSYGTHSQNMQDMLAQGRHGWRDKTHCPRGHLRADPNLASNGWCLACARAAARVHKAAKRGVELNLQEVSDKYYEAIMREAASAAEGASPQLWQPVDDSLSTGRTCQTGLD